MENHLDLKLVVLMVIDLASWMDRMMEIEMVVCLDGKWVWKMVIMLD